MKKPRVFPSVTITKKQEQTVKKGHPWIYSDEIVEVSEEIQNGSVVDVFGTKGNYLGSGFFSTHSKIRIRLLGNNANETYDDAFFIRKVDYAVQYRQVVMAEDYACCRLIHGEADGLPGLTVDRYGNLLVAEVASYGIEQKKDVIYARLKEDIPDIRGIYERNEGALRAKEGLPQYKGWYGEEHPSEPITDIEENGIRYRIDVENGQKTGFFLDQKYNRKAIARIVKGKRVLDCCTHNGTFALNCAKAGAAYVCASDISKDALKQVEVNAQLNHCDISLLEGDVFEVLPRLRSEHERYDVIILDPPAFTKARRTFHNARNGYREINAAAMRLLGRGGYLATCSCSHFMPRDEFMKMLCDSAADAGVAIRIIEQRGASPDHPVLPNVPETEYLKFVLLQVI